MIRSLFSALRLLIRTILALILIAGLVFVAFAGYKGSQPMQQEGAHGMTYWQFMCERIEAVRELPARCRSLYLVTYLTVPPYALMYTYVGVFPESFLARYTNPNDPWLPKTMIQLGDAPSAWWSQMEKMTWHALTADRGPMPECNLPYPK
ncbi:MAG: hypothetical protein ROW48_04975 [Bellilinea sp.]|jgi:hypothetical protein